MMSSEGRHHHEIFRKAGHMFVDFGCFWEPGAALGGDPEAAAEQALEPEQRCETAPFSEVRGVQKRPQNRKCNTFSISNSTERPPGAPFLAVRRWYSQF